MDYGCGFDVPWMQVVQSEEQVGLHWWQGGAALSEKSKGAAAVSISPYHPLPVDVMTCIPAGGHLVRASK